MNLGLGILLSAVHATTFIAEQKFEVVQFLFNQTLDIFVNTNKLLLLTMQEQIISFVVFKHFNEGLLAAVEH